VIAIEHPDQVLPGDPSGHSVPATLLQEAEARNRKVVALISVSGKSLRIALDGEHGTPPGLTLRVQRWGDVQSAQGIALHRLPFATAHGGVYGAELPRPLDERVIWYAEVAPSDGHWLLTGQIRFHEGMQARLMPSR
jgi:hypothetical protein